MKKVKFNTLKIGICFRLRKGGSVYQKYSKNFAQRISGRNIGDTIFQPKNVIPAEVKIKVED